MCFFFFLEWGFWVCEGGTCWRDVWKGPVVGLCFFGESLADDWG